MRSAMLSALVVLSLLSGCGREGAPPEPERPEQAAPEDAGVAAPAVARSAEDRAGERGRFLPDEMRRPGGGPDFPHSPHVEIACSVCHVRVRGHGSHATVRCVECHAASEQATRTGLTSRDCMACHHGAQQTATCSACHDAPGVRAVERTIRLDVWPAGRSRLLPFDHARHEAERCEACHEERPSLAATASCGSCHEDHHRPDADCAGCHTPPRAGAHTLEAHLGCSGGGCHSEPGIEAMAQARPVCLVCHQAQMDHELGKECADCHQVRGLEP